MEFSILIPHYKNAKITAYTISQLLKCKGEHRVHIWVVDNSPEGEGNLLYLKPFLNDIKYQKYPKDKIQSHGVSFDFILPHITTDWFITIESDAFPTNDTWLDYYENIINEGHDAAGSILKLSGGEYMHPAGALYSKKIWQEAKRYCNDVNYAYFPNMATAEGFDCHLMIHKDVVEDVLKSPYDYIELSHGYKGYSRKDFLDRMMYYSPIVAPFHNGMGRINESVKTYGYRDLNSEPQQILLAEKPKLIKRIGYEPGQWLTYFMYAMGKKVFQVPTEVKWLKDREGQQQQHTLMENGFCHIWAGSSFLDMKETIFNDVYEFKKNQIDELYNSLPENQKIKIDESTSI